jgi:hypothetical protein
MYQQKHRATRSSRSGPLSASEAILATPDAPPGQRACDVPLSARQEAWLNNFLHAYREIHRAAKELDPSYDHSDKDRFLWRALEVRRITGLSLQEFDRLSTAGEIDAMRFAIRKQARLKSGSILIPKGKPGAPEKNAHVYKFLRANSGKWKFPREALQLCRREFPDEKWSKDRMKGILRHLKNPPSKKR